MPSLRLGVNLLLVFALAAAAIGVAATFLNPPPRNLDGPGATQTLQAGLVTGTESASPSASLPVGPCGIDIAWLRGSIAAARFETAAAQIALQRSTDTATRALAQRLLAASAAASSELEKLAGILAVGAVAAPGGTQEWSLLELKEMTVRSLEHDYPELEAAAYDQAVEDARLVMATGCAADVIALATRQLPGLQENARAARAAIPAGPEG